MAKAINAVTIGGQTGVITLPYGVCDTASNIAAKTVTVDNFALETGAVVLVKIKYSNTAAAPTLNVNDTGAKLIKSSGSTAVGSGATTGFADAGAVIMFVYDGTNWIQHWWYNTDTTYSAATYTKQGLVSTSSQIFGGKKYFGNGLAISNSSSSTTDCATFTYDGDTLTLSFG
jgi:hypothetical protein